jgi:hypothetical protein
MLLLIATSCVWEHPHTFYCCWLLCELQLLALSGKPVALVTNRGLLLIMADGAHA